MRHARASSWEPIARKDASISSCTRTRRASIRERVCVLGESLRVAPRYFNAIRRHAVTTRSLSSRLETYKLRRGVSIALLIRVHIFLTALFVVPNGRREELREGLEETANGRTILTYVNGVRNVCHGVTDKRRKRGLRYHLATGPDSGLSILRDLVPFIRGFLLHLLFRDYPFWRKRDKDSVEAESFP